MARRYIVVALFLMLIPVVLWYQGWLADLYADYPQRTSVDSFRVAAAPLMVAHRGHEFVAPENTAQAFEAAIALGADYIEVDMRLTSDGVPVVLHDVSVNRTTDGKGKVNDLTFAEVQQLDAGSWFSPEFAGARIPTVQEILELANGRTCVFADIKDIPNRRLINMLRNFAADNAPMCMFIAIYGFRYDINQFDADQISAAEREQLQKIWAAAAKKQAAQAKMFKRYWPGFPYIIKYKRGDDMTELLAQYPNAVAVDINWPAVDAALINDAHKQGLMTLARVPINQEDMTSLDGVADIYRKLDATGLDALFVSDLALVWEVFGLER